METDSTTKTCQYCGKELPIEAIFCYYCRRELITRPERPEAVPQSMKSNWLLIGGFAFAVIVVLALIFFL
jgi:hypothetical protein